MIAEAHWHVRRLLKLELVQEGGGGEEDAQPSTHRMTRQEWAQISKSRFKGKEEEERNWKVVSCLATPLLPHHQHHWHSREHLPVVNH